MCTYFFFQNILEKIIGEEIFGAKFASSICPRVTNIPGWELSGWHLYSGN